MEREFEFTVSGAPDEVYAILSDPDRFTAVHPLIHRMRPLGDDHFMVTEYMPLGPVRIPFRYPARITKDPASLGVSIRAVVHYAIRIDMDIHVRSQAPGSQVKETIRIRSWMPGAPFLANFIRKQHALLFQNLEKDYGRPAM